MRQYVGQRHGHMNFYVETVCSILQWPCTFNGRLLCRTKPAVCRRGQKLNEKVLHLIGLITDILHVPYNGDRR